MNYTKKKKKIVVSWWEAPNTWAMVVWWTDVAAKRIGWASVEAETVC